MQQNRIVLIVHSLQAVHSCTCNGCCRSSSVVIIEDGCDGAMMTLHRDGSFRARVTLNALRRSIQSYLARVEAFLLPRTIQVLRRAKRVHCNIYLSVLQYSTSCTHWLKLIEVGSVLLMQRAQAWAAHVRVAGEYRTVTPEPTNQCFAFGIPRSASLLAIMMHTCWRAQGLVIATRFVVHLKGTAPSTGIPRRKNSHANKDCAATEADRVEMTSMKVWMLE